MGRSPKQICLICLFDSNHTCHRGFGAHYCFRWWRLDEFNKLPCLSSLLLSFRSFQLIQWTFSLDADGPGVKYVTKIYASVVSFIYLLLPWWSVLSRACTRLFYKLHEQHWLHYWHLYCFLISMFNSSSVDFEDVKTSIIDFLTSLWAFWGQIILIIVDSVKLIYGRTVVTRISELKWLHSLDSYLQKQW